MKYFRATFEHPCALYLASIKFCKRLVSKISWLSRESNLDVLAIIVRCTVLEYRSP